MELIIHNPSEDGFLKEISFNHEELKQELSLRLEKYKGLVYSDEEIKLAKTDRATLNKFKEAIETKRKEIKKQCMKPYEDFEAKIKEILALVDAPISEIDGQVKAFEDKQKEEKKAKILDVYNENIENLTEILPFQKIFQERWLNATITMGSITKEITSTVEKVKTDLQVIETLNSEFDLQVKDKYLQTLDLTQALQEKTRLEEQKAKLEEFKKQQEQKTENVIQDIKAKLEPVAEQPIEQKPIEIEQELEVIDFRVYVTSEQKRALKEFLINNNIKVGKVR